MARANGVAVLPGPSSFSSTALSCTSLPMQVFVSRAGHFSPAFHVQEAEVFGGIAMAVAVLSLVTIVALSNVRQLIIPAYMS